MPKRGEKSEPIYIIMEVNDGVGHQKIRKIITKEFRYSIKKRKTPKIKIKAKMTRPKNESGVETSMRRADNQGTVPDESCRFQV
jgi:hypothetical protein